MPRPKLKEPRTRAIVYLTQVGMQRLARMARDLDTTHSAIMNTALERMYHGEVLRKKVTPVLLEDKVAGDEGA